MAAGYLLPVRHFPEAEGNLTLHGGFGLHQHYKQLETLREKQFLFRCARIQLRHIALCF